MVDFDNRVLLWDVFCMVFDLAVWGKQEGREMSKKEVTDFFRGLDACKEGRKWAQSCTSLEQVWDTCQNANWMLWILRKIEFINERKLRLYACACVRKTPLADGRTVWDLLTDERSRKGVETRERYERGEATEEEMKATYTAAQDAAYDAATTDAYATYVAYAARAAQAKLLREWISWDEVETAIKAYKENHKEKEK